MKDLRVVVNVLVRASAWNVLVQVLVLVGEANVL